MKRILTKILKWAGIAILFLLCLGGIWLAIAYARSTNDCEALASAPGDPWFDPKRALNLARKAVAVNPADWAIWNTLGVAAYRVRDWGTAAEALRKSIQINGGAGIDCFFLAMTRWHQGKRDEARQWFDQAIAWIERTRSEDPEVRRFHAEAAGLMGLPGPGPRPGTGGAPEAAARGRPPAGMTPRPADSRSGSPRSGPGAAARDRRARRSEDLAPSTPDRDRLAR